MFQAKKWSWKRVAANLLLASVLTGGSVAVVHAQLGMNGGTGSGAAMPTTLSAVLTFFGFMHGESIGIAVTPTVAIAYAIVAAFLFSLSRYPATASAAAPVAEPAIAATPAE